MSRSDQFQQYAEEAVRWAFKSKIENEKQAFLDLARAWTQAAFQSERTVVVTDSPPEVRTPQ
jgi:hypothetical protein